MDWSLRGNLPKNEHTAKYLRDFPAMAEVYRKNPITVLPFSLFRLFHETGSRVEYEDAYFDHRRRMNVFLLLALDGREEYLPDLEDILAAICEEYTWVLPAHLKEDADARETLCRLDLFSAETAFALSETLHLLKEKLHPALCDRIRHELRRRVVEPYLQEHRAWGANNWSAVCAAGVIATFVYLDLEEEFQAAKPYLLGSMDKFIGSYEDDGCCTEGPLYWQYGFGFFCYGAELLRQYTHGEIDYFRQPKVHAMALYGGACHMTENFVLPFSDGPHRGNLNAGLYHFLRREYGEMPTFDLAYENIFGDEARFRTPEILRNLYWFDDTAPSTAVLLPKADFPISQQSVRNFPGYSFACKGGHNDEPHNHNDLGSFFVLRNGEFLLDDPGWCEYDKFYFKPEHRYADYICTMSQGHSLPILNGKGQSCGREHRAQVLSAGDREISLLLSDAYDIPGLYFRRTFRLTEDTVTVEDEIRGAVSVTERFVTRVPPKKIENGFCISDARLTCDYGACLTEQEYIAPLRDSEREQLSHTTYAPRKVCNLGMSLVETLYFMDFQCPPEGIFRFCLSLGKRRHSV